MRRRTLGPQSDPESVPAPEAARLILYTRRGCHLCDEMRDLLRDFADDYTYVIDAVDIDGDPALRERFNEWVPALYLGEKEICHHHLDLARLRAALGVPPAP